MSKAKGLQAIYQWVIKTMMKDQTGVMQTLPKKDLVDVNVQITAQRLMQEGVDPTTLKNLPTKGIVARPPIIFINFLLPG